MSLVKCLPDPIAPSGSPAFPPSGALGPVGTCLLSRSWAWASHALFLLLAVGAGTRKNIIGGSTLYILYSSYFYYFIILYSWKYLPSVAWRAKADVLPKRSTLGAKFQTPFILEGSGFQSDGCKLHTFVFPHPCTGSSWFLCLQSPERNGLLTVKWSIHITRTWLPWAFFFFFPHLKAMTPYFLKLPHRLGAHPHLGLSALRLAWALECLLMCLVKWHKCHTFLRSTPDQPLSSCVNLDFLAPPRCFFLHKIFTFQASTTLPGTQ